MTPSEHWSNVEEFREWAAMVEGMARPGEPIPFALVCEPLANRLTDLIRSWRGTAAFDVQGLAIMRERVPTDMEVIGALQGGIAGLTKAADELEAVLNTPVILCEAPGSICLACGVPTHEGRCVECGRTEDDFDDAGNPTCAPWTQ